MTVKFIKVDELDFERVQNEIHKKLKKEIPGYNATKYAEMNMRDKRDGKYLIPVKSGMREIHIKKINADIVGVSKINIEFLEEDIIT